MFVAFQAAGLANGSLALSQAADSLFASAGGKDYNGSPLINSVQQQPNIQVNPQNTEQNPQDMGLSTLNVNQNTSPGFPANPGPDNPLPPESASPIMPESPETGAMNGIETMRNERLQ